MFVPVNPLLKPEQVGYILRDCNVRVLVTSPERLALLAEVARRTAPICRHVVVIDGPSGAGAPAAVRFIAWDELLAAPPAAATA